MKNLIRMDFYRLFHAKAIRIGVIAAVIVAFFGMLFSLGIIEIFKFGLELEPEAAASMSQLFPMVSWIDGVDFANVVLYGTGMFSLFIACMVSASFVSAEQSCGYFKNVAGQLSNKGVSVFSKFVVTSFVYVVIMLIYTLVSSICALLFFSKYLESYSIGALIGGLCLRTMLYLAINAIMIFLCTLTKSQSLAMVIGAILGTGITQLAYFAINGLLGIVKINLNVSHFMPDGISGLINAGNLGSLWLKAIIVSIVFIAGFLAGAMVIVNKRDVK